MCVRANRQEPASSLSPPWALSEAPLLQEFHFYFAKFSTPKHPAVHWFSVHLVGRPSLTCDGNRSKSKCISQCCILLFEFSTCSTREQMVTMWQQQPPPRRESTSTAAGRVQHPMKPPHTTANIVAKSGCWQSDPPQSPHTVCNSCTHWGTRCCHLGGPWRATCPHCCS